MIQVTMLDTVELATYSVRTFALYKVRKLRPARTATRVPFPSGTEAFSRRAVAARCCKRRSFRLSFPMFAAR